MDEARKDSGIPTAVGSFDLERFVVAQDAHRTYDAAVEEIRRGRKASHWMWFVFPQIAGLGQSATSRRFAIRSLDEARAYLEHPILGSRLRQSSAAVLTAPGATADAIFGHVDARKLRSSMTLFAHASPADAVFVDVIDRWFDGAADEATLELLGITESPA